MQTFRPLNTVRVIGVGVSMALMVMAAVVLRTFNPASTWFFPPCPFRALTGFLCPGCGTLRALHELLTGHFTAALRLNPLMMVLLPYVGYSGASSALEVVTGQLFPRVFIRPVYMWMLVATILLFWILRNIPF